MKEIHFHTSGILGLIDMMKKVMTLAVPGIVVCMAKRRCIAVDVKKPNMIMKLKEFACLEQYFANVSNALKLIKRVPRLG